MTGNHGIDPSKAFAAYLRINHRLPMMTATKELEKRLDGVLKRAKLLK